MKYEFEFHSNANVPEMKIRIKSKDKQTGEVFLEIRSTVEKEKKKDLCFDM